MPLARRERRSKKANAVAVASVTELRQRASTAPRPADPREFIPPGIPRGKWLDQETAWRWCKSADQVRAENVPDVVMTYDQRGQPVGPVKSPVVPQVNPAATGGGRATMDLLVGRGLAEARADPEDRVHRRQFRVLTDAEIIEHERRASEAYERYKYATNVTIEGNDGFLITVPQREEQFWRECVEAENRRRRAANLRAQMDEKPIPYPLQAGAVPFTGAGL